MKGGLQTAPTGVGKYIWKSDIYLERFGLKLELRLGFELLDDF